MQREHHSSTDSSVFPCYFLYHHKLPHVHHNLMVNKVTFMLCKLRICISSKNIQYSLGTIQPFFEDQQPTPLRSHRTHLIFIFKKEFHTQLLDCYNSLWLCRFLLFEQEHLTVLCTFYQHLLAV